MAKENIIDKNYVAKYTRRYSPSCRLTSKAFFNLSEFEHKEVYKGESITDKESYRLNLASQRGSISTLTPSQYKGWYMFENGKFDKFKDFSYVMRKDLTITEIDEYTEKLKAELESADKILKKDIESQIEALNNKKSELQTVEANKGDSTTSSE